MTSSKLRLGLIGPMKGGVGSSHAEDFAKRLQEEGYALYAASPVKNRFFRLLDMIFAVFKWRNKIDLLILMVFGGANWFNDVRFMAWDMISFLAKRFHLPQIYVLHGGSLPYVYQRHPRWVSRVLSRADLIVSPSNYLASFFEEKGFSVRVIPNALSIPEYPFRLRSTLKPKLFWMRTFHWTYHPEMAVLVLEKLLKVYPNATLTMAGQDKGLLESVKKLVGQKGLSEKVCFAGFLDEQAKKHLFSSHDIFLNTNRLDNTPVSLVESAAFGLPIVATAIGGIPYMFEDRKTALLVKDSDVEEMNRCIQELLANPDLAKKITQNARQMAEDFDWSRAKSKWADSFSKVLDK